MLHVSGIVLMDWMQVWYDNGFVGSMSEEFEERMWIAIFIFFQQMFNLNQTKYHNKRKRKIFEKIFFSGSYSKIFLRNSFILFFAILQHQLSSCNAPISFI